MLHLLDKHGFLAFCVMNKVLRIWTDTMDGNCFSRLLLGFIGALGRH
jgi:hypothetical protein